MAGVYNEYLLKEKAASTPLMLQNAYMCTNSIVVNFAILVFIGRAGHVLSSVSQVLTNPHTALVICFLVLYGLITSILLKELNSILKTYAAAVEIFTCGLLSHYVLGTVIDVSSVASLLIVAFSCYLYVREPVVNYSASTSWQTCKPKTSLNPV
jgi:hypothetical protein